MHAGLKAADIEPPDRATDSWPGAKFGLLAFGVHSTVTSLTVATRLFDTRLIFP